MPTTVPALRTSLVAFLLTSLISQRARTEQYIHVYSVVYNVLTTGRKGQKSRFLAFVNRACESQPVPLKLGSGGEPPGIVTVSVASRGGTSPSKPVNLPLAQGISTERPLCNGVAGLTPGAGAWHVTSRIRIQSLRCKSFDAGCVCKLRWRIGRPHGHSAVL